MRPELEEKLQEFEFDGAEGASDEDVTKLERTFGKALPEDLREILVASDGILLKSHSHQIQIWSCQEIADYNHANKVHESTPDFIMFGSNGGGETYALDYRGKKPSVALVPAVGFGYKTAVPLAKSILELLIRLQDAKPLV